jgi:hypothetical protein
MRSTGCETTDNPALARVIARLAAGTVSLGYHSGLAVSDYLRSMYHDFQDKRPLELQAV